jgi:uncharacterized protein with von Willebrand factor type A (vWA) domain
VTAAGVAATGEPMLDLLGGFIRELREAGLPVSLTEHLDAMEAVKHIPLEDREAFKYALAATLVKNNAHWRSSRTLGATCRASDSVMSGTLVSTISFSRSMSG